MPKRIILLFLCSFLLCSCFESSNPLSDPSEAKVDERLEGVWVLKGDKGERLYLHFTRGGKDPFMSIVSIQDDIVYEGGIDPDIFFPTHLETGSYLNIQEWLPEKNKFSDYYKFYKYEVIGRNTLRLWMFANRSSVIDAVEDGSLRGRLIKLEDDKFDVIDRIEIFDDSSRIADFIEAHDQEIFDGDPLVFHKVPEK